MTKPGEFEHRPVLLAEAVEALAIRPGGLYVDCTVGGGGHARAVLERAGAAGRLLGLDADSQAVATAAERLAGFANAVLANENFRDLGRVAQAHGFSQVDGVLFDLGVSSFQLDRSQAGFSFQREAPLDMRFSPSQPTTAADLVNGLSEHELASLIWRFGEERLSRRIARGIVLARPLRTTTELAEVVERSVGRRGERIHPATRTFQALRIATNEELDSLGAALPQALELLRAGGRLAVISFHSLEDRIVKDFLRQEAAGCVCPPRTPVCICGHRPRLRLVTRKPIVPSQAEQHGNPRSRSAKLRVAERL